MTLLLFNSHTLIFFFPPYHFLHSILRFQACVMDLCPQDACVRPLGKPFLLYYSAKKLVTDVLMSVRYNVIWPCLGVSTALHHFFFFFLTNVVDLGVLIYFWNGALICHWTLIYIQCYNYFICNILYQTVSGPCKCPQLSLYVSLYLFLFYSVFTFLAKYFKVLPHLPFNTGLFLFIKKPLKLSGCKQFLCCFLCFVLFTAAKSKKRGYVSVHILTLCYRILTCF